MNINLINSNIFGVSKSNNKVSSYSAKPIQNSKLMPLKADTVSFTGGRFNDKGIKNATYTIFDIFGKKYDDALHIHEVMGKKLIDTASIVANEIEGVEFSSALYGEKAVKGKDSYLSKIVRSGAMPLDQVRTTVNIKDITNMTLLTKFLTAMRERGYEVRMIPVREGRRITGYRPDLDIRRDDVPASEIAKLPKMFQSCVSGRVPSGLGDIQIRFVDKSSKCKDPQEVIIMIGDHSGLAKRQEENDIYVFMRSLKDELSLTKGRDTSKDKSLHSISESISAVGKILRSSISIPMYTNAEALDTTGKSLGLAVGLTPESAKVAKGYLNSIGADIETFYRREIAKLKGENIDKSLESRVKATSDFKSREDKTIYADDLSDMRKEALKELYSYRRSDREMFAKIREGLVETIDKYTFQQNGTTNVKPSK